MSILAPVKSPSWIKLGSGDEQEAGSLLTVDVDEGTVTVEAA